MSEFDDTLIDLNPDQKLTIENAIKELYSTLADFQQFVKSNTLSIGIRDTLLELMYGRSGNLYKLFDLSPDSKTEELYGIIRGLNQQLRDLHEKQAEKIVPGMIGTKLYELNHAIYDWWKGLGFSYCKSVPSFYTGKLSFMVDFSVSVNDRVSSYTNTPVTDQEEIDDKIDNLGKELELFQYDREWHVEDNDNNREWFKRRLSDRFPGSEIYRFESHVERGSGKFSITKIDGNIRGETI